MRNNSSICSFWVIASYTNATWKNDLSMIQLARSFFSFNKGPDHCDQLVSLRHSSLMGIGQKIPPAMTIFLKISILESRAETPVTTNKTRQSTNRLTPTSATRRRLQRAIDTRLNADAMSGSESSLGESVGQERKNGKK